MMSRVQLICGLHVIIDKFAIILYYNTRRYVESEIILLLVSSNSKGPNCYDLLTDSDFFSSESLSP